MFDKIFILFTDRLFEINGDQITKYTIENCYTTTESGVTELLGKDVASAADSAIVTSHALAEASITGSALYGNEDISLDFAVWTARTNDVPVLNYFVGPRFFWFRSSFILPSESL